MGERGHRRRRRLQRWSNRSILSSPSSYIFHMTTSSRTFPMAMGQQLHLPRFATSPTITLVGRSAPPKMMQMLTYLAMKHNTHLLWANTVRAYSFGALYLVEALQSPSLEMHEAKSCTVDNNQVLGSVCINVPTREQYLMLHRMKFFGDFKLIE